MEEGKSFWAKRTNGDGAIAAVASKLTVVIGLTLETGTRDQGDLIKAIQDTAEWIEFQGMSDAEVGLSEETKVAQQKTCNYVLKSSVYIPGMSHV